MESETRFESALDVTQGGAEAALKSAGGLTRELRKARDRTEPHFGLSHGLDAYERLIRDLLPSP